MSKNKPKNDLIDWEVTDAPHPEPAPKIAPMAHHPKSPARRWGRWTGVGLIGFVVLLIVGIGLYAGVTLYLTRLKIEELVTQEDQLALTGDTEALAALWVGADSLWIATYTQFAQKNGLPAPIPLPILRPVRAVGQVRAVESFSADTVRADVERAFITPSGETVNFITPQFYQRSGAVWRRLPAPETYLGDKLSWAGARVRVNYYAVDYELAQKIGPYLDTALQKFCTEWRCAPNTQYEINLVDYLTNSNGINVDSLSLIQPTDPLLFTWLIQATQNDIIFIPPLHVAGYPADDAAREFFQRALAWQWVANITLQSSLHNQSPYLTRTIFFQALAARVAARHLDEPTAPTPTPPPRLDPGFLGFTNLMQIGFLWNVGYGAPPDMEIQGRRGALELLNRLLADQPATAEAQLIESLYTAGDPMLWLGDNLHLSIPEIQNAIAGFPSQAATPSFLPQAPRALALACKTGLVLFSPGDPQASPLFTSTLIQAIPISWSPEGDHLLAYVAGFPAVLDLPTGTFYWLPYTFTVNDFSNSQWVSNTQVAYLAWQTQSSTPDNMMRSLLTFYDPFAPAATYPALPAVQAYTFSPDKSQLVVTGLNDGLLSLLTLGEPLTAATRLAVGYEPKWTADGQSITYFSGQSFLALDQMDLTTRQVRPLALGEAQDFNALPGFIRGVWSNTGQYVLALSQSSSLGHFQPWLRTLNSAEARPLEALGSYPVQINFSADDRYLGLGSQREASFVSDNLNVMLYETATSQPIPFLGSDLKIRSFAWSPTGHQLILTTEQGVYLLSEPGAPPQKVLDEDCLSAAWNPNF